MPKLPVISGFEVVKALSKLGYKIDHQTGSHIILRQDKEPHRRLTVPNHKELAKCQKFLLSTEFAKISEHAQKPLRFLTGTLRAIIRQAGLTVEEFINLL